MIVVGGYFVNCFAALFIDFILLFVLKLMLAISIYITIFGFINSIFLLDNSICCLLVKLMFFYVYFYFYQIYTFDILNISLINILIWLSLLGFTCLFCWSLFCSFQIIQFLSSMSYIVCSLFLQFCYEFGFILSAISTPPRILLLGCC